MLIDDLRPTPPHKEDREVVELSDLALKFDPVDKKHSHIKFVLAEMPEECVLDRSCRWCGHIQILCEHPPKNRSLQCSAALA